MRLKWILPLAIFPIAACSALLSAQQAPTPVGENPPVEENFIVTSDVTYTQGINGPLKADVYIPMSPGLHPGIVFIHGGGWVSGNRNQMIKVIKAMADAGYVGFTIDYDLGKSTFPGALNESLAAVRFFRAHAAEYHLDPFRIAVAGSSAGGELAALVGLAQGDTASPVAAAIVFNGAPAVSGACGCAAVLRWPWRPGSVRPLRAGRRLHQCPQSGGRTCRVLSGQRRQAHLLVRSPLLLSKPRRHQSVPRAAPQVKSINS